MEIILAKPTFIDIEWQSEWGGGHETGDIVRVKAIQEICTMDDFDSYNNVISLNPTMSENDWEMQLSIEVYKKYNVKIGDWIYAKETEFGGLVENIERIDDVVKLSGANFRGYLMRHIVSPPYDAFTNKFGSYTEVNTEANNLLWWIWDRDFSHGSTTGRYYDPYVIGLYESTGTIIQDKYRYDTYLSALTRSLKNNGMRLETKHVYIDYDNIENEGFRIPLFYRGTQSFVFSLSAKPVTNYSNQDLFSQDYDLRITSGDFRQNERRYLWCLGSGELENREIVVLKDGYPVTLGLLDTQGSLWNSAIFDYPNAESREELIKAGQERYFENYQQVQSIELFVDDADIEFFLGDIISGEDFITGIYAENEIVSKELTITNGVTEIRYKIGGR